MKTDVGCTGGILGTWGFQWWKGTAGKRDLSRLEQSRDALRLNIAHCILSPCYRIIPLDEDPTPDARSSVPMMMCSCRVLHRAFLAFISHTVTYIERDLMAGLLPRNFGFLPTYRRKYIRYTEEWLVKIAK
ncbi:hypothetical protein BJX63DRAFT_70824 [Aspergillus granulosus]|uniref:Uncharacterized protein n=1 Tax=Aspergillus granulosus TaxID=176169 RepID=A0ABR4HS45_9EURO